VVLVEDGALDGMLDAVLVALREEEDGFGRAEWS
jgi:hypothetical protein